MVFEWCSLDIVNGAKDPVHNEDDLVSGSYVSDPIFVPRFDAPSSCFDADMVIFRKSARYGAEICHGEFLGLTMF